MFLPCLLLFHSSLVMSWTSFPHSAWTPRFPVPHQYCWQWQTGLAGEVLSPTTGEEKTDQVLHLKLQTALKPPLRAGVLFLPRSKDRPLRQLFWQQWKTWKDVSCEQRRRALTFDKRPDHLCIINLPLRPMKVSPETPVLVKSPQDRLLI